jgi:hypothetical protein
MFHSFATNTIIYGRGLLNILERAPMKFKDEEIRRTIEQLAHQYHLFISNQFINYYLTGSKISKSDWMDVEELVGSNKYFEGEGYDLNKLYEQVLSFVRFMTTIRNDILPRIKSESEIRLKKLTPDNQILYKMTLDNTPGNLKVFLDLISTFLVHLKRIDKENNGAKNMLYVKLAFMKEVEKALNV